MKQFDFNCRPEVAWLTVNRKCNFRCQWCYGEDTHYTPRDNMSIKTAKELVKIAAGAGVKHFNIIGGEPTLWPGLFELNKFCKSLGVTTGLITNAARFGDDEFWEKYKQCSCDNVSISVKSADPIQFMDVTKAKAYNQTMKGIERGINFHDTGISTVYNSLVGMDGLKLIASRCRELGARHLVIDLCTPVITDDSISKGFSIEPHQLAMDIVEMQPYLSELYDGQIEIETFIPLCLFPESFVEKMIKNGQMVTLCHVYSRSGINFDTNGDIMPCNQLFDSIIARKGVDYTDSSSLLAHLNNSSLRKDYKKLLRYPSDTCVDCRWKNDCRGGCLLNWMVFDPSICHAIS